MTAISYNNFKKEITFWLRNNDFLTTTERDVTTTTATGTFASATSYLLNVPDVKNIRSIVVDAVTLSYGTDYVYDNDYLDTTIKTRITFTTAQTGAYVITYDYGSDKIHSDLPRNDLTISSFPRIGVEIIGEDSEDNELGGGSEIINISFMIVVYHPKTVNVDDIITAIKSQMLIDKKSFFYGKYMKKLSTGPLTIFIDGKQKIFQRNIDYLSILNEETV